MAGSPARCASAESQRRPWAAFVLVGPRLAVVQVTIMATMLAFLSGLHRYCSHALCAVLSLVGAANGLWAAPERVFRCGNLYTNVDKSGDKACEALGTDRISVFTVPEAKPAASSIASPGAGSGGGKSAPGNSAAKTATRISSNTQRQRDAESRQILEAEWRKAQARLQELQKEYNNGEPERLGPEVRNPQKYLDRVAELKANMVRAAGDLAGLRRELARLPAEP